MSQQPQDPGDRSLAQAVLERGDERAFRALYRRHTPYLYQFVLRTLGGNELDADDVVQETWVRAVDNLADFRWEGPLKNWLLGIALNLCRGLFRRKDRHWLEIDEERHSVTVPKDDVRMDVEAALACLPDGYRTVLLLHDLEGYKHGEIAEMLGTSEGTSKSQLFHARRTMRTLLERRGQEVREDHA